MPVSWRKMVAKCAAEENPAEQATSMMRSWASATMSSGGSDAISGVTILLTDVIPSLTGRRIAEWIRLTFGGPAIPSTLLALCAGVFASLMTPPSKLGEAERLAAVRRYRR